ncbi:MAG: hypothetical protein LC136_07735 [Burkholderiales bacterium]|nr:hypothetical protein [Burkholderiales bacterium]
MSREKTEDRDRERDAEEMRERLRELLPPGSRVWTHIDHVSRSGMSRDVLVFCAIVRENGRPEIMNITGMAAVATGAARSRRDRWAIVVGGCGFDAGHHVVMNLSYALHGFGREGDSPAQVAAREGPTAIGADDDARRPGYTLRHERL